MPRLPTLMFRYNRGGFASNIFGLALRLLLVALSAVSVPMSSAMAQTESPSHTSDLFAYIDHSWDELTRSMMDCKTLVDPKVKHPATIYLPQDYPEPPELRALQKKCTVRIRRLPQAIHHIGEFNPAQLPHQGLLYLPNPYVVPGGRFNEMYGWDSYFILLGLLRDGRLELARGMVENFFFEIEHYGGILNANRTYYLTRSQPPFLSSMVMALYHADRDDGRKRAWLEKAYPCLDHDYRMWNVDQHLAGDTGLSRYFDFGEGPVPEVGAEGDSYYLQVFRYLQASPERHDYLGEPGHSHDELIGPAYTLEVCEHSGGRKRCQTSFSYQFTADYYLGDRAMRESGFDVSFRFGAFGGHTHHYAPVCLNSLLYKTETDMAAIAKLLGKSDDSREWSARAEKRKQQINHYLWDQKRGMFFDYDFTQNKVSDYEYATAFYPLWAGLATPAQAEAVMAHLATFERPGGLAMSPYDTGVQWDLPYGWAPVHLLALDGMRRYGFAADADRIARKWIQTVSENFQHDGTVREKYNVVTRSSEAEVTAGYEVNVVGFGWTNAVVLEFAHQLHLRLSDTVGPE